MRRVAATVAPEGRARMTATCMSRSPISIPTAVPKARKCVQRSLAETGAGLGTAVSTETCSSTTVIPSHHDIVFGAIGDEFDRFAHLAPEVGEVAVGQAEPLGGTERE